MLKKISNLVHLSDATAPIEAYAAIVAWGRASREGAGPLSILLLGQRLDTNVQSTTALEKMNWKLLGTRE